METFGLLDGPVGDWGGLLWTGRYPLRYPLPGLEPAQARGANRAVRDWHKTRRRSSQSPTTPLCRITWLARRRCGPKTQMRPMAWYFAPSLSTLPLKEGCGETR